ncbi:DUF2652 domain-containing protein [Antarcticibacterium arcticum]|uniref:DUF2652 domain-containing protein n=1 Tax=Antarcticibacterium arcticum TaxID=2585771 RepID=UPI00143D9C9E|nr:DUF2652 domain-containing protein [Antarcticibacterium arcticum]
MKRAGENRDEKQLKDANIGLGNILIPDISGFTSFVTQTDLVSGQLITQRLLTSLLENDLLDLELSEIEGDAALLYKYGRKLRPNAILKQYEGMLENFHREQEKVNKEFNLDLKLSLKLIAHYGKFGQYELGSFRKLYGAPVIEAHRLLKNSVKSSRYVLITDDLLEGSPTTAAINNPEFLRGHKLCESYDNIRDITFTVFDYEAECSPREILERSDSL